VWVAGFGRETYHEGDHGEEEEQVGDPGREEGLPPAFAQALALLQHQVDQGEQHAVDHRLRHAMRNE